MLILHGHMPTTKAHVRRIYPSVVRGCRLRQAVDLALTLHHEDRFITIPEAREVMHLGRWVQRELRRVL